MDQLRFSYFADKLTAEMSKLNGFANPGPGDDQDLIVRGAVMTTTKHFLREPQFQKKRIDAEVIPLGAVDHRRMQQEVANDKRRGGSIVVMFYGEDHDSLLDGQRALAFLASTSARHDYLPSAVVLEKGLTNARQRGGQRVVYDTDACLSWCIDEAHLTRSTDAPLEYQLRYQSIWAYGLSRNQRSWVVAGYLAVCLANGNQSDIERIGILFGSEHANMLDEYLEYLVQNVATSLWARRRIYITATSLG